VLTACGDLGARRIELAEVGVPPTERRRALRALTSKGWRAIGPGLRRQLRPIVRARQMLSDGEGRRLRLSWRTPAVALVEGEPPIEAEVQGTRVPVPSVLVQLAAACDAASAGSGSDVSRLADVLALTRAVGGGVRAARPA
ncbi:MAG: hypothetical protein JOZ25_05065, partial [Actinobacteria bacterium]|nr:hypothetical protein [Actinomycetota bacterium]